MVDLILWRHAEARDAKAGESDLERPLTARGQKQAQRVAEWLNRHLPESTRILVSPAQRARQTADALGRKYRVVEALAPDTNVNQLLTAVRWPASQPMLVVGHQPALGQTAAYLMEGAVAKDGAAWAVRKGAAWWLRHRERDGEAEMVLVAVCSPDKL